LLGFVYSKLAEKSGSLAAKTKLRDDKSSFLRGDAMDADYFLKKRTEFIRFFYDTSAKPFAEVRRSIEEELPPYDDPPYSEDPEPAYLDEWMDTATADQILGLACVSLLSDSLKLYFQALQQRVIGFSFVDERKAFKHGFISAYLGVLGGILDTDWADCPADLTVIEQIVLARNRGQHGGDLTTFDVLYDWKMLEKHPLPFFVTADERESWIREEQNRPSFLMPSINVTRDNLFAALGHVEVLAEWIESRMDKAWEWRRRQRVPQTD
jgi:hypothetical protein